MTLRSYVGLPLNHLKGQAKEEEEKTTGLVMENISLKIINLFEILFLKFKIFFYSKIIEINHTFCKVQKFSYFFINLIKYYWNTLTNRGKPMRNFNI